MLLPFQSEQPLSVGLRAGGKWINWAKSTPARSVWESPFVTADHLQLCKPDSDFPTLQEATIDDGTIYTSDSIATFVDGKLVDLIPVPPGFYSADGPHSLLADPGFEQVQVGAGKFVYRPTGSPWTFTANSGITTDNSGFTTGNAPTPEGTQVAFLQGIGSFSQTITGWTIGTYLLTFAATQRAKSQTSRQDFNVLIDGHVVGTCTPQAGLYQRYATGPFAITAGSHTITFQGVDTAGGDNTAFVDSILPAILE